jgi:hypothetical protein
MHKKSPAGLLQSAHVVGVEGLADCVVAMLGLGAAHVVLEAKHFTFAALGLNESYLHMSNEHARSRLKL